MLPTPTTDRSWLSNIATTAPATEPITVAEAKAHCRIESAAEDARIPGVIAQARDYIETLCNRPLIVRQFRMKRSGFPRAARAFALPSARAASLIEIAYTDPNGDAQTLSLGAGAVELDADQLPSVVRLKHGASWPATLSHQGYPTVSVTYSAGWANAAAVPPSLTAAVLLAFGHFWDGIREAAAEKPLVEHDHSIRSLVAPFVVASVL